MIYSCPKTCQREVILILSLAKWKTVKYTLDDYAGLPRESTDHRKCNQRNQ